MRFTALFELCKYIQVLCFVDWGAAYDKIVGAWIWDIIAFLWSMLYKYSNIDHIKVFNYMRMTYYM